MTVFRFYIVNCLTGSIKGSNKEEEAKTASNWEDYYVIDTWRGELVQYGKTSAIQELDLCYSNAFGQS